MEYLTPNFLVLGADGTGKDTLCAELEKVLGRASVKFPGAIPETLEEAFHRATVAAADVEPYAGVIWNRFFYPDDLIYGSVVRRDDERVTTYWRKEFRTRVVPLLKTARFHVVLLRISTATAEERGVLTKPTVNATGNVDAYHNLEWWQWHKICHLYEEEVNDFLRYQLPTRVTETTIVESPMVAEMLMQFAITSVSDPRWNNAVC